MGDDAIEHLCRYAIGNALRIARASNTRLLVGLEEFPDGSGRFGHMTEPDARLCVRFVPAWLVTPRGEVVACKRTDEQTWMH